MMKSAVKNFTREREICMSAPWNGRGTAPLFQAFPVFFLSGDDGLDDAFGSGRVHDRHGPARAGEGQHFGHGAAPRYLWPRLQVFQPPRFGLGMTTTPRNQEFRGGCFCSTISNDLLILYLFNIDLRPSEPDINHDIFNLHFVIVGYVNTIMSFYCFKSCRIKLNSNSSLTIFIRAVVVTQLVIPDSQLFEFLANNRFRRT
jgi:hypothetical protein